MALVLESQHPYQRISEKFRVHPKPLHRLSALQAMQQLIPAAAFRTNGFFAVSREVRSAADAMHARALVVLSVNWIRPVAMRLHLSAYQPGWFG
jgi:hypothetical protein